MKCTQRKEGKKTSQINQIWMTMMATVTAIIGKCLISERWNPSKNSKIFRSPCSRWMMETRQLRVAKTLLIEIERKNNRTEYYYLWWPLQDQWIETSQPLYSISIFDHISLLSKKESRYDDDSFGMKLISSKLSTLYSIHWC